MNEFLRKFDTIRFVAPWNIFRIFLRVFYFFEFKFEFWIWAGLVPVQTGTWPDPFDRPSVWWTLSTSAAGTRPACGTSWRRTLARTASPGRSPCPATSNQSQGQEFLSESSWKISVFTPTLNANCDFAPNFRNFVILSLFYKNDAAIYASF